MERERPSGKSPGRVLFTITSSDTGGAESVLLQLVTRLDRSAWEPFVCSLRSPGRVAEAMEKAGVPVIALGMSERPRGAEVVRGVRTLAGEIDALRIDVVQSFLYRANFVSALSVRLAARRPALVMSQRSLDPLRGRLAVITSRLARRLADRVVAVSTAVRDHLLAKGGTAVEEIVVIPNGVDTDKFRPVDREAARSRLGLREGGITAGGVGRLTPVKGFSDLLESARRLRDEGVPIEVVLAGDGPERGHLERKARDLGLQDSVVFLGVREDIETVYAALDIFVLSSLREGSPNALLEAMSCERAVVATRVGGVEEIVEDGRSGVLVSPESPAEITRALAGLAGDPERRERLARAARQRVIGRFDLPVMVARYEELYRELSTSDVG